MNNGKFMTSLLTQSKIPKYLQLAEQLRAQIASGELTPEARLPTVAQIQAQLGVSQSTVDKAYALLEQEGLIVREQGRGTFVAQPSLTLPVRSLGLWMRIPATTDFYMMEVLAGVREEASRRDLQLIWLDDAKPLYSIELGGVILSCEPNEAMALGVPAGMPQILLFHHSPEFTCVVGDDFQAGKIATRHLIELGHRRIACLLSSDFDSISRRRLAGYHEAMQEAGLEATPGAVRFLGGRLEQGYRHCGAAVMQDWLETQWHQAGFTGIVTQNDETAAGVINACNAAGLQVPGDVSIVGCDGTALSELVVPALTTIKIPLRELGSKAVEALDKGIMGQSMSQWPKVVLPVELLERKSTRSLK
jgi:DNA-binding LacI/PurR family transcriptional regulator